MKAWWAADGPRAVVWAYSCAAMWHILARLLLFSCSGTSATWFIFWGFTKSSVTAATLVCGLVTSLHQNSPAVIGSLISCVREPSGSRLADWTSQLMSPIKSLEGSWVLVSWGYAGSYAPSFLGEAEEVLGGGGERRDLARERDRSCFHLRTKPFSSQCILYNAAPMLVMFLLLLLTATR